MWHHHPHHHHCIVSFCPELSFTCRVDLLSANIPNISLQRGFWDKVSRVEEIKIIYQSQQLEGYKYTCTMGHSFCGKTEVLQIFKRDLFNTLPPGKWPHGPIHSACGTEGAPGHWGDTPTTMTIMLKLAKNMLMNRCLMRMMQHYLFFYVTHLCFQSGCIRSANRCWCWW